MRRRGDVERYKVLDGALSEIESSGNRRFRYLLITLTGFAYFVEAAELTIVPLLLPKFVDLFQADESELALVQSLTAVGMVLGVLVFGRLSDLRGRRWVLQVALALSTVSGFASSFASSVKSFAWLRFFLGIGYGGTLVNASPLLLECIAESKRSASTSVLTFFWGAGSTFTIALCWLLLEDNWRLVVQLSGIFGIPAWLLFVFYVPESPRYFIMRGQYAEAFASVERMALSSNTHVPVDFTPKALAMLGEEEEEQGEQGSLVFVMEKPQGAANGLYRARATLVPLAGVWFLNSFGTNIGGFFPLKIQQAFASQDLEYVAASLMQVGEWIGAVAVAFLFYKFPRILEIRIGIVFNTFAIVGVGFASAITSRPLLFVSLVVFKIGISVTYHGLYTYTPEVFSTQVRVAGFSICQLVHRAAPVVSPYLVAFLDGISFQLACSVYAGFLMLAACLSCFLFRETSQGGMVEDDDGDDDDDDDGEEKNIISQITWSQKEEKRKKSLRLRQTSSSSAAVIEMQQL